MTFLTAVLFSIILCCPTYGSEKGTQITQPGTDEWETGFDGDRAWKHVAVLASDSLRGRYSGFAGADKAEKYIENHFEHLGVKKPFGDRGYFHDFTYGAGEYAMPSSVVIHTADGVADTVHMWQEFNIFKYSGFGKVRGKLVFVGYGISAPEKGWDEYEGIDVTGAVILAVRETPDLPDVEWRDESASGYKSTTALEKGAVGFILTDGDPPKLATISEKYYRAELPAVWISRTLADSLLKSTGKTKEEWIQEIKDAKKPVSRVLDVDIELQVSGEYYPERPTRNIVGVIPGSDPKLRHETIMIGAHMDHHGTDAAGNVYPGADDNASGTATMMELAEIFSQSPIKYKRSLMFAGFAAEEEGLVGSKALVKDLPIIGYDLVAMINMDMVGQGDGSIGVGGIDDFPLLGDLMFADMPDTSLEKLAFWSLYGGSDHASFQRAGVPSYVVGARGKHPNYHTPDDTAGAIKPEILKGVGEMVYHCAEVLANHAEPMIGEVGKAKWLLRQSGVVEFATHSDRIEFPHDRVKGVPYHTPIRLVTIDLKSKRSSPVEDILSAIETARVYSAEYSIPFMADSSRESCEPFTGTTIVLPAGLLPGDSKALKALTRLGLSFVDVTGIVAESGGSKLNKKTKRKLQEYSVLCKPAGVRMYLSHQDQGIAEIVSGVCGGQVLFKTNADDFEWDKLQALAEADCFTLIDASEVTDSLACVNFATNVFESFQSKWGKRFGMICSEEVVQAMIDQEMSDYDIQDVLFDNLQSQLNSWWKADKDGIEGK